METKAAKLKTTPNRLLFHVKHPHEMERMEWDDLAEEVKHYSSMDEFICPYCGYVHKVDHTEIVPDDLEWETEYDCDKCGRTYIVTQTVIVSHQTYKCKEETN